MAVNAGDVVRVVLNWVDADFTDEMVNVFHLQNLSGLNYANDANYMLAAAAFFQNAFAGLTSEMPVALTAAVLAGQNLTQNQLMPDTIINPPIVGTNVGERMPRMCVPCAFFRTTIPRKIGRTFLPALVETSNTPRGVMNPAAIAAVQTFADALIPQFNSGGILIDYVVYNRLLQIATKPVVGLAATDWRTQRRRRPGVGS